MTYSEALDWLEQVGRGGSRLGLDRVRAYLTRLGAPQDQIPMIHVAGTNGKGSVSACLSAILTQAGYRVGLYTSPHLDRFNERFRIRGEEISDAAFADLVSQGRAVWETMEDKPTEFEVITALAFLYFAQSACDLVVLECGMGGMTDATNVVKTTVISVFAEIGMDHMGFLGNTVEEIAAVKAGIIKPGTIAVSAAQRPEVSAVLQKTCAEKDTEYREVRKSDIKDVRYVFENQTFTYKEETKLKPGLTGSWQIDNAALAVEAVQALRDCGWNISDEALRKGLTETVWQGRFTTVSRHPLFIVDGAHNRDAADRLRETLELYFPEKRKVFIAGVLADKEYDYVMSQLTPLADRVITVMTPNNPRALAADKLAEDVKKYNPEVESAGSLRDAVHRARAYAGEDDMILAFGSLSYLGDLMREIREQQ